MIIPTEPIGSIPRPLPLIDALSTTESDDPRLDPLYEEAIRDTIERFEATGSPVALLQGRVGPHRRAHLSGGDRDSTHSADVDYAQLLPSLFELNLGNFYIALAGEREPKRALKIIRDHMKPGQRIFIGVTAPIDPRVETPEHVCDRVLRAAEYIPPDQLGTTDDCGFSPFNDDRSTSRDTAFAKIRARVLGTVLAAEKLGRA